jgi:Asp-tRNA(Asn)/Glu-tRNA(Gln) amidotransferase C subunit
MNELIKSVKKFSVTDNQHEFEKSLELVIDKFELLNNESCEWDLLKSNYSKLRYLNYTLEKSNLKLETNEKFLFSLNRFMEYIDKVTQVYLKKVDWESESEFSSKSKYIHTHLTKSLNSNDSIQKMKEILNAYSILVPIVEDIHQERFVEIIDDEDFLQEFKKARYT